MGTHRRIATAAIVLATVASVLLALPASAGSPCSGDASTAPDGKIRIDGEAFQGGAGDYPFETVSADFVPIGQHVAFTLKWKNVSETPRTIRVARNVLGLEGYASRYFVDGVNVTQKIKSGISLAYRDVPSGRSVTLAVVVRNKSATESDQGLQYLLGRYKGAEAAACDALGPWMNNFG